MQKNALKGRCYIPLAVKSCKLTIAMDKVQDIRFLTERGDNVWWFDGERVIFRSNSTSKILNLMYAIPDITIQKLSDEVGINVAAINKQLKQLTTKGFIQRVEKDGTWRLIITPSI